MSFFQRRNEDGPKPSNTTDMLRRSSSAQLMTHAMEDLVTEHIHTYESTRESLLEEKALLEREIENRRYLLHSTMLAIVAIDAAVAKLRAGLPTLNKAHAKAPSPVPHLKPVAQDETVDVDMSNLELDLEDEAPASHITVKG